MAMTLRQALFYLGPAPRAPREPLPTEIDGIAVEVDEGA
jgi:hypothetical protein